MAYINNRAEFVMYIKRRLGYPVIQINIDDAQIDDRIDDALSFYQTFHFNAVDRVYISYALTADDITNKYVIIPHNVDGIMNLWVNTSLFMQDYSFTLKIMQAYNNGSMSEVMGVEQAIGTINAMITKKPIWTYNKNSHKCSISTTWTILKPGNHIMYEALVAVDPDVESSVWNDQWLKRYATALVKRNWGENLSKYEGLTLPGGTTINGEGIRSSAETEIEKLETEVMTMYQLPVTPFIVG